MPLHATMLSCTWLNVMLFIRGVSNDSSRSGHKRRLCNLPCGNFTRTRSALQEDCAFQRHSTIAILLHTIHVAELTLDSCRFMICMRLRAVYTCEPTCNHTTNIVLKVCITLAQPQSRQYHIVPDILF